MKCCLCNKPAKFLCSCVERKLPICYTHMKSHIRESGRHVFDFLPEILKNSMLAKVKAELHFLKKNIKFLCIKNILKKVSINTNIL